MLQDIRDNSQGVIAKVIIGLIVAIFALFGVESIIGGFVTSPPVAEINGEEINEAQLQAATQNLLNSIGGNAGSLDQELLEQIALNQIVEETVLRQLSTKESMLISSDRIDRSIIENPNFQINGAFDPDLAVRTMASQGYSVPIYRESLRQQMALSQIANAYTRSNFVTDSELERIAELSAQSRNYRYLSITLGTRTLGTPISDAEIQEYYDSHQDDFTKEETAVVRYVLLDQDVIAEEIAIDEADILAQYEVERAAFEGSAEKRASHILFEVSSALSEEQAMAQAVSARERLVAGEDFAALALELSSDVVSAEDGGDIGYSDGSAFPPEIEAALANLAVDEISQPVITEFGVHLVKLTEDSVNVFQPLAEVRDRIERELKRSQVALIYAERLDDLSNLAFETADLEPISQQLNLAILQSGEVPRSGAAGIFSNPDVIAATFSDEVLLDGNNSDVIELNPSQAAVIHVEDFNEASLLPMAEVEPEIAVILRTEMERDAVQALGNVLLTAIEAGDDIQPLLDANELEWITADGVRRNANSVNREINERAFSLPAPSDGPQRTSMTLANGTFVMIELNDVIPGTISSLSDTEKTTLTQSMLVDLGNSDFDAFLTNLKADADIQTRLSQTEDF